jgi:hypothetical protein
MKKRVWHPTQIYVRVRPEFSVHRLCHSSTEGEELAKGIPVPLLARVDQPQQTHHHEYHRPRHDQRQGHCEQRASAPQDAGNCRRPCQRIFGNDWETICHNQPQSSFWNNDLGVPLRPARPERGAKDFSVTLAAVNSSWTHTYNRNPKSELHSPRKFEAGLSKIFIRCGC